MWVRCTMYTRIGSEKPFSKMSDVMVQKFKKTLTWKFECISIYVNERKPPKYCFGNKELPVQVLQITLLIKISEKLVTYFKHNSQIIIYISIKSCFAPQIAMNEYQYTLQLNIHQNNQIEQNF